MLFIEPSAVEKVTDILHPIEEIVFKFLSLRKKVLIRELNSIPNIKDKIQKWMDANRKR